MSAEYSVMTEFDRPEWDRRVLLADDNNTQYWAVTDDQKVWRVEQAGTIYWTISDAKPAGLVVVESYNRWRLFPGQYFVGTSFIVRIVEEAGG
jgi:hypothetical protein